MISTAFHGELAVRISSTNLMPIRTHLLPNFRAILVTSSRGVSDPRTDPGASVWVPRVGSLTSRLLSGAGHPRGQRRRKVSVRSVRGKIRNPNVLKGNRFSGPSRSSASDERARGESASMLEG